jgi:hypothetical protein
VVGIEVLAQLGPDGAALREGSLAPGLPGLVAALVPDESRRTLGFLRWFHIVRTLSVAAV